MSNGLRLLLPARKSRKGDGSAAMYDRQEAVAERAAEREGHVIIDRVRDIVTSQSMPWDRKNLKTWMTDPVRLAMYDGILVETDRLSRADDRGWHYIEHWCYEQDKRIVTTEGVQFPPRDDSDRYQWVGLKRRARTYWEDVRAKHAAAREVIKANGGAIGLPPFGYVTSGTKYRKVFVIDAVTGPLARAAFQRIADGHTATSVAVWLSETTGKPWRVKRVTDMIRRRTYLGERDGHTFEPLVADELWSDANAALSTRSFTRADTGGRRTEHGYSGLIFCECGARYYRHQSERGQEKYRCGRGRRGDVTETRCSHGAPVFADVNAAVDRLMKRVTVAERVRVTTGGDHGRQMELHQLGDAMKTAMSRMDMEEVTRLASAVSALQAVPAEPIRTMVRETGRTMAAVWSDGDLSGRRALLARGDFRLVVRQGTVRFVWEGNESGLSPDWKLRGSKTARQLIGFEADRTWNSEPLTEGKTS